MLFLSLFAYMYVCVYMSIYIYIYTYIYTYMYLYTYICISLYTHTHIYNIKITFYCLTRSFHLKNVASGTIWFVASGTVTNAVSTVTAEGAVGVRGPKFNSEDWATRGLVELFWKIARWEFIWLVFKCLHFMSKK